MKTPAADAYEVLQNFWDTLNGSTPLPIDPAALASNMGIRVVTQTHRQGIIRSLNAPSVSTSTIAVPDDLPDVEQNLEIAKEIGETVFVNKFGRESDISISVEYAKRFADALLMPKQVMEHLVELGLSPTQLASRLHVPLTAVERRLINIS